MARVEEMSFEELVTTLFELEKDTVPQDLERTMHRAKIDRRLMRLISTEGSLGLEERRGSIRVPGDLQVKLTSGDHVWEAQIVDIGEGGLRVRLDRHPPERIDVVEVELVAFEGMPADQHPPRARARISWRKKDGGIGEIGLGFVSQPESHRRRMRWLVLEILKRMKH
jgi:hypothetical protein